MQAPTLELWELIVRVAVAAALGGIIGIEREYNEQPAGFRTHMLVSLGAALFAMVGAYGLEDFFGSSLTVRYDPTRIAAQIVTGIGFLGAGAILRQGVNVRGLTTAAALWVTAAIGMAIGFGYWAGGITVTAATLIALLGLKQIERRLYYRIRRGHYRVNIEIGPALRLSDLSLLFEEHNVRLKFMQISTDDEGDRQLVAAVALPREVDINEFGERIAQLEGVRSVDWEG